MLCSLRNSSSSHPSSWGLALYLSPCVFAFHYIICSLSFSLLHFSLSPPPPFVVLSHSSFSCYFFLSIAPTFFPLPHISSSLHPSFFIFVFLRIYSLHFPHLLFAFRCSPPAASANFFTHYSICGMFFFLHLALVRWILNGDEEHFWTNMLHFIWKNPKYKVQSGTRSYKAPHNRIELWKCT